jgi:hypothetical protein
VTAIAVDLKLENVFLGHCKLECFGIYLILVGNSSMPKQSKALKPMMETKPKTQDNARLAAFDFTR